MSTATTSQPPAETSERKTDLIHLLAGVAPLLGAVVSIALTGLFGSFHFLWQPIGLLILIQAAWTGMQSLLWLRYRPFVMPEGQVLPRVSVLIPAFNEGPMVENSIRSVALSDYPLDRLEIIVVDDGSRDDTFFHMRHLRRQHPHLIRLVRFRGNCGKRAALYEGFLAASGEFVVTIDSDSQVESSTIREMIVPFLTDSSIGAVAGRVAVLNRDSFISRMLEVQYALAFDFGRAAQSTYRAVSCCPGALSAFRAKVVQPHLKAWTKQMFLGRPVSHGEDQALTNIVLRSGYDTVYQSSAVIHTLAPTAYRQLSRMFVRWDRSFIVEGFSFAKFMFTRYRKSNRLLPIVAFLISSMRIITMFLALVSLPALVGSMQFDGRSGLDMLIGGLILLGGAGFTALYYLRLEKSFRFLYGVAYAVFSVFCLQWILPWALITVRDERWGTR